jgi:hypothetical protein
MARLNRFLARKNRDLLQRIAQSMRDAGSANSKCRGLQRKLARLNRGRKAIRTWRDRDLRDRGSPGSLISAKIANGDCEVLQI